MTLFKKLSLLPMVFLSCCGCTQQRIFVFGKSEKMSSSLLITTWWDKDKEIFGITFINSSSIEEVFTFSMSTTNAEIYDDFKTDGMIITFDNNEEVPFDENGEYKFINLVTFHIGYKNFSERSKEILLNYPIDFNISYRHWVFDAKNYKE